MSQRWTSAPRACYHSPPMRGSIRRRLFGFAMASPLVAFLACAQQGEGERCSVLSNDDDCDEGLTCVSGAELQGGNDACCPPAEKVTSKVCARGTPRPPADAGVGGAGGSAAGAAGEAGAAGTAGAPADAGTGGAAGSAGMSGAGGAPASCSYDSDCAGNLVCGPTGRCQTECRTDKDCEPPKKCSAERCVVLDAGSD